MPFCNATDRPSISASAQPPAGHSSVPSARPPAHPQRNLASPIPYEHASITTFHSTFSGHFGYHILHKPWDVSHSTSHHHLDYVCLPMQHLLLRMQLHMPAASPQFSALANCGISMSRVRDQDCLLLSIIFKKAKSLSEAGSHTLQ